MAEEGAAPVIAPKIVEYDPVTGVPSEYNEYLPQDSVEYKRWKAAQEGGEGLQKLTLKDSAGNEIEKKLPGGKVKKKQKPEIVVQKAIRNKSKCITTVTGLDLFGIKLAEASKLFGKKFACGCSVTKSTTGAEQIDMQGDFLDQLPDIILKQYKNVTKADLYYIDEDKKKRSYFDDDDESGDD